MNIFGEGFPQEIIDQIAIRQKVYGSGYSNGISRTPEEIIYLNGRTAWCKLISSVDIDDPQILNNPIIKSLNSKGSDLAKQFVLFNGTAYDGKGDVRGGINDTRSILGSNHAYGIGGTEFGLRPMMGIISANINHENRGSLRLAEVKMKAFNRDQFEIIDTLYLRLGFSVLLEWGNSMYFDNKGNFINTNTNSLANDFLKGTITYDEFLKKIQEQRIASNGNYDAMFAKVTNFHWSFLPDGSYDITVNLSSAGDIIESLKVNCLLDSSNTSIDTDQTDALQENDAADIIASWANTHTIGSFLFLLKTLLDNGNLSNSEKGNDTKTVSLNGINATDIQNEVKNNNSLVKFDVSKFDKDNIDAIRVDLQVAFYKADPKRYYVRLGTFLKFIQDIIIPKAVITNTSTPLLKFDYDETTNLMNVNPLQVSLDPRICLVNRTIDLDVDILDKKDPHENRLYGSVNQKNPFINDLISGKIPNRPDDLYGNIMNIYVDSAFIIAKIEELKDDKGNLSLIDFLQAIMSGINEGLGGINDFDVFIDETLNIIRIIDKNPLKNLDEVIALLNNSSIFPNVPSLNGGKPLPTEPAFFDLYGYYNGTGNASFIKEFSFTTEITPQLSTMITVGATSNGSVVGENDTAISRINKGLVDRFKTDIITSLDTSSLDAYKTSYGEHLRIRRDYVKYLQLISNGTVDSPSDINATFDDMNANKTGLSSFISKQLERDKALDKYVKTKFPKLIQGSGFIPFNLSLTMDGLAGMKINQQFNIDTSFLPSNYPDNVRFLIKNLSHEIKDNKWNTKLESYCIAKSDDAQTAEANTSVQNTSTPSPTNPTPKTPPTPPPPPPTNVPQGKNADLWTLVAICAAENFINNPLGMADVAQSIYNRYKAGTYGRTIKDIIIARGQYEPTFKNINDWAAIQDKDTAITAYKNAKQTSLKQATLAINTSYYSITNETLKSSAAKFIGSRTEFLASYPNSSEAVGMVERSPSSTNNVFYWRYDGKIKFYNKNILVAQPPPPNLF